MLLAAFCSVYFFNLRFLFLLISGKYMKLAVELSGYNYVDYFTRTTHSFNGKSKKFPWSLEIGQANAPLYSYFKTEWNRD
jgi:hypothetical protein